MTKHVENLTSIREQNAGQASPATRRSRRHQTPRKKNEHLQKTGRLAARVFTSRESACTLSHTPGTGSWGRPIASSANRASSCPSTCWRAKHSKAFKKKELCLCYIVTAGAFIWALGDVILAEIRWEKFSLSERSALYSDKCFVDRSFICFTCPPVQNQPKAPKSSSFHPDTKDASEKSV